MKIGLLDIDCHAEKKKWGATVYPNLALCKIAAWHKQQGDTVEWATPFEHYDILYRAKIFNFTQDDRTIYDCDKEVRGGSSMISAWGMLAFIKGADTRQNASFAIRLPSRSKEVAADE